MSGGSFNYLYSKEPDSILHEIEELDGMVHALESLSYAKDAAEETREILKMVECYKKVMERRLERIAPVWKAMEWWKSMDYTEREFINALVAYGQKK